MRIGIEVQRLFRPQRHGMDVVALELLRELAALDHGHELIAFVRPDHDREVLRGSGALRVVEVPAPYGTGYAGWEQAALPRAARAAGVDLLHCTANTAPLAGSPPLVVTLHDVIFLEGAAGAGGTVYQRLGNVYRRLIAPRAARRAEAVVTVSATEAARIVARLPDVADRLEVVPNAVSRRFAPPTPAAVAALRSRHALPERFVLVLGNPDPRKNLAGALAGWATYVRRAPRPLPLVVAGAGVVTVAAALASVGAADLRPRVHVTGFVADGDLPALYGASTAFLFPSLREGFGLPVLEAMACGTPVVTSAGSPMAEAAGDAALLVDPGDAAWIASALGALTGSSVLRGRFAAAGLARAAGFSWRAAAERLVGIYERVASSTVARRSSTVAARSSKAPRLAFAPVVSSSSTHDGVR